LDEIGLVVYEEMSFKSKNLRTTDGRTKSDHKSSPCHKATGGLKIAVHRQLINYLSIYFPSFTTFFIAENFRLNKKKSKYVKMADMRVRF
jgi:hypothetical protein